MTRYAHPLLLVALVGVVFAPLWLHANALLYPRSGDATDLTITHWPAVAFNVHSLRQDGQVPLWRTTIASGGPWAANPQSWLYYPPAWLCYLLPIDLGLNLLLVAHLALAALATYAFGRVALQLAPPGAALAGLAFAVAPWLSGQLAAGHINVVLALAWLPVALLGAHRAATMGSRGGALLAGTAWAAALLNHAQMAAFTATLTVGWYLLAVLTGKTAARRGRQAGLLLLMPAAALLLSAVLLLPLIEALPYLNRTRMSVEEAGILSLSWPQLVASLIPTYGGEPEHVTYLGLPVATLAGVGLVLKRDRASWFLASVAVVAIVFALGTHGPLFPLLFRLVPGLGWLRVPARAWAVVALSLALLAGRGLDALSAAERFAQARRRVTLVALGAVVAGLILAGGLAILYQPLPPAVWAMAGLTLATAAVLFLSARSRLRPPLLGLALLLLVAIDGSLVRAAWTEMRAPEDAFAWGAETARFLARQPGPFRVYSPDYRLPQHTAVVHDLSLADGVDPFQLEHYAAFLALAGGYETQGYSPTLPPRLNDASARPDAYRLGLLNVGYVAAGMPLEAEGLVLEAQEAGTYLYRNEQVLPRAFVVVQPQTPGDTSLARPVEATAARITRYTPNTLVVEADLARAGLLVLSEVWYPGWRAVADGIERPILRVEGILRGVYLDAGSHRIEFGYSPWTVWVGLAVSGLTAATLLVLAVIHLWRRT
jgi:hypothetical protein